MGIDCTQTFGCELLASNISRVWLEVYIWNLCKKLCSGLQMQAVRSALLSNSWASCMVCYLVSK